MTRSISWGRPAILVLSTVLLLLGIGATAARTIVKYQPPGKFDPSRQGMCDFHNGIYYPTAALLDGTSPYGKAYAETWPVDRPIPFFSPAILVLHAPFALLPLRIAEVLFFLFSIAVVITIAVVAASAAGMPNRLDVVIAIAAAITFTRAGHITLFDGYFTFELVLATFLAIHWGGKKPLLAALALVVVSAKPTYILPLGFLMLARGNLKALVIGAVLSIIAAGVPFAWLAHHEGDGDWGAGVTGLRQQITDAQEFHRSQEDESPVHSWTRVDLLAVIAKWTAKDPAETVHLVVMAVLLVVPMLLLNRRRIGGEDDGLAGLTGAIILTALLASLYHQSYDVLLLAPPAAGVLLARLGVWRELGLPSRLMLAGLMLFPAYNYLSTRMFLLRIDPDPLLVRILTSLNGISLAVLLIALCWLATEKRKGLSSYSSQSESDTPNAQPS